MFREVSGALIAAVRFIEREPEGGAWKLAVVPGQELLPGIA